MPLQGIEHNDSLRFCFWQYTGANDALPNANHSFVLSAFYVAPASTGINTSVKLLC